MHNTAVTAPFGSFNFTRTPFGLRNSGETFQHFNFITSPDHRRQKKHLKIIFTRLAEYGIIIGPEKCQFGTTELGFLGHHVSATGISPLASAVVAIVNFVGPEKQRALRRYLGMINYYHRFIPNCTFIESQQILANATLLVHLDHTALLNITCDASDVAVGGVLQQYINNVWQPLSFFSKKLTPAETRYSAFDRELLAVYTTIRYFRHNLEDRYFFVNSNDKPLTFVMSSVTERPSLRQTRQLAFIAELTTDIRYVKGETNFVANALSRPTMSFIDNTSTINYKDLRTDQALDTELM